MMVTRRDSRFRYLLGASFCVTLFLIGAYRLSVDTVAILTLATTVWAFLDEPYPASMIVSGAVALALPAAGLAADEFGTLTAGTLALTSAASAILGALLIRARENTITLQRYINRLEENVHTGSRSTLTPGMGHCVSSTAPPGAAGRWHGISTCTRGCWTAT